MMDWKGEKAKKSKEILMDAAIEVFSQNGFHAANVDDIVQKAGCSKGTFYYYFESKEALVIEIMDTAIEALKTEYAKILDLDIDFEESLKKITQEKINVTSNKRNFIPIIFAGAMKKGHRMSPNIREKMNEFMKSEILYMTELFEKFKDKIREDIPVKNSVLLFSCMSDSVFRSHMFKDSDINIDADSIVSMFLDGAKREEK